MAWRRSTAGTLLASGGSLETCQKETFFEFHSALRSVNGVRLRTSRRSKLPWLETGALSCRVTPAPQVSGIFALASAGNKNSPGAMRRMTLERCGNGRLPSNVRSPALAAAYSRELLPFQIARGPAWNHKSPFRRAERDRGSLPFRESPLRTGGLWQT